MKLLFNRKDHASQLGGVGVCISTHMSHILMSKPVKGRLIVHIVAESHFSFLSQLFPIMYRISHTTYPTRIKLSSLICLEVEQAG